jgi:hypothetical protein
MARLKGKDKPAPPRRGGIGRAVAIAFAGENANVVISDGGEIVNG